jgi:integrase
VSAARAVAAPALDAAVEAYLDRLRTGRRLSAHTLDAYARDLADYAAFARAHRLADWSEATVTVLDGYFASLARRGLAASTLARRRSTLRGFHAHLQRTQAGAADPVTHLAPARRERRLPRALAIDAIERLLDQVAGEAPIRLRDRALLELAYASGLRVSELCGLERPRVDLAARIVTVTGKGGKERTPRPSPPGSSAGERRCSAATAPTPCSSTRARGVARAASSAARASGRSSRVTRGRPASPRSRTPTCCAIRSRPTCCKGAPICGSCRSCSATRR